MTKLDIAEKYARVVHTCTLMYMLINMWSYAHNVAGRLRERETQM